MKTRFAIAALLAAMALAPAMVGGVALAQSQEPAVKAPPELQPDDRDATQRIVDETRAIEEDAWTFRYLIPTALLISALVLVLTGIVYAARVKARYRVAK